MSLTSCFRYIIELSVSTLDAMIGAVVQEGDSSGTQTSFHQENVPVGGYTATVDALLDPEHLPTITLTPVELGLVMHLTMQLKVEVNEVADLDPINYQLTFDLPGNFQRVTSDPLPVLTLAFPGLSGPALNLNVSGGDVMLTPGLIEPQVHTLYAAHPELAHSVQTGVSTPLPAPNNVWAVTVDLYDDAPGSMPFRGSISVEVPDSGHIRLNLPGHLRAQSINATAIDSNIVVHVQVLVIQTDGLIRVAMSQVTGADVAIDWASPNLYTIGGETIMAAQFAARIATLGDLQQPTPTQEQIRAAITGALVTFGTGLTLTLLKPKLPANATDMDLTTFQPTTLGGQLLALQIEPQPVPCDVVDAFLGASAFAVSVDAEKTSATIQPVVDAENGRHRNISGHDVEVHDLTAELADPGDHGVASGHIWIAGQATIAIDCWPDSHISFSGPVTLTPDRQADGTYRFTPVAGSFSADDPCCASANPDQIAQLIQGDDYPPFGGLPSNFSGVGQIDINLATVDISRAGLVLRGTLDVVTAHSLAASQSQHSTYWANEPAGGG